MNLPIIDYRDSEPVDGVRLFAVWGSHAARCLCALQGETLSEAEYSLLSA